MILLAPPFIPRAVKQGTKVVGVNQTPAQMAENVGWSMATLREQKVRNKMMSVFLNCMSLFPKLILPCRRLRRVLTAYFDQRPFSIDLVGAVS